MRAFSNSSRSELHRGPRANRWAGRADRVKARAAPARVEQREQLRERLAAVAVIALEHLVHDDAEALMHGLLCGDAQDARELVAQRTTAIGVDVGGRQRETGPLVRQERMQRALLAAAGGGSTRDQRVIERGGLEYLALQRRGGGEHARVDVRERVLEALPVRTLEQRGELQQLQVAHDSVRDVEVGVESQLAEPPADAHDAVEHLLTQQLQRGPQLLLGGHVVHAIDGGHTIPHVTLHRIALHRVSRSKRVGRPDLRARRERRQVLQQRTGAHRRRAAHEPHRQRTKPPEALLLRGGLLGCEKFASARAQALDQAREEHIGGRAVELGRGAAVERDEAPYAFARLGWHLRRLGGGGEAEHEIELACAAGGVAPPRHLDHTGKLHLAQLDGRPGQRAHDRSGIVRVDQQPHPGEYVAHLGALQKRACLDRLGAIALLNCRPDLARLAGTHAPLGAGGAVGRQRTPFGNTSRGGSRAGHESRIRARIILSPSTPATLCGWT